MFSGFEYNKEFEEACEELATERDPQQVRRRLMSVEWVLWEAIRGVFLQISSMVAALASKTDTLLINGATKKLRYSISVPSLFAIATAA